ncbi:MAG: stage II sporulation protein D [Clostridiales bacterium]|jgi:stage II sporulation protein D|nr:stage II sporulation protein D [Clostridiales bacterium]
MKAVLIVSILLLALAFSIPLLIVVPSLEVDLSPSPGADTAKAADSAVISFSREGRGENISLKDYLTGVVAAEMPASFNIEALKAQAVAARTYALYKIAKHSHQDFDLCDNAGCCSAYFDHSELRERWGRDYDNYIEKICSAVEATDGLFLSWADEPILAVFHSSSPGRTEGSENVWSSALPYLVPVDSPETPERVSNLISTVTVSAEDFKNTLLKKFPNAVLDSDPRLWISYVYYTESGRVKALKVGGIQMSGTDFRFLFGLRSTAFTFKYDGNFVFSVTGYGHGVGMSQYGANIMAADGALFDEILAAYYPGTELSFFSGTFPP